MSDTSRTIKLKLDADAKGLVAATKVGEREVDKFTKSVDKKFRTNGDDSSKSFASRFGGGLKKWFRGDGQGLFKEIGKSGGTVFGSGLLGALKTPILGPAILGAVGAAAAIAAPAVGAIAASGVVAGFGAGLAGLGIAFAAKNKDVQAAWKKTLDDMAADMSILSKPFEKTLIAMSQVAKRTFGNFKPALDAAFQKIAPALTRFGDQVGRALEQLAPAVRPLADAFAAVLDSLGPALQSAVRNIASGLQKLADSVKANPDGLADLADGAGKLTGEALGLVAALNDMNGSIKTITGGVSGVDLVMAGLSGTVGGLKAGVSAANGVLGGAATLMEKLGLRSKDTGDSTATFSDNLFGAIDQTRKAAGPVETLAQKYERQWQALQKANDELFRNSGLQLSLSGAQINYQEAVDRATESIKQNGKTHDINTEKGRANKRELDNVAEAANRQTEAMRNAGDGNVKAAQHGDEARRNFVKLAQQMGYSKTEAEKMAAKMIAIPNVSREAKLTANKKDLDKKLAAAQAELKNPNLTKERRATLTAYIGQLKQQVANANAALASVKSKTVTITTVRRTVGPGRSSSSGAGGGREFGDPGRASGGPVFAGRSYLVGERGPEILTLGTTSRITNAEQTAAALSAPSQPIVVENHIEIGGHVVEVVRQEIKASDRETRRRKAAGVRPA